MDLPNIYQNKKEIKSNNQIEYQINNKTPIKKDINIKDKINSIFKSNNYIYKIPVIIKTKNNEEKNTYIIGKTNRYLITIDNELIQINDIVDINENKKS